MVSVHLPEHLPPPLSMVQGPAALASLGSHTDSQVLLSKTLPFWETPEGLCLRSEGLSCTWHQGYCWVPTSVPTSPPSKSMLGLPLIFILANFWDCLSHLCWSMGSDIWPWPWSRIPIFNKAPCPTKSPLLPLCSVFFHLAQLCLCAFSLLSWKQPLPAGLLVTTSRKPPKAVPLSLHSPPGSFTFTKDLVDLHDSALQR